MKNKILSIIIPVYNVEAYLIECIKSICDQCSNGYEIILVDDGSTDGSGKICDNLTLKNKGIIHTIHKENGGLSSARNTGLQLAKCKYVAFLDSDDRIAEGSLIKVLDWAENFQSDMCFMQADKFFKNGYKKPLGDGIKQKGIHNKNKAEVVRYLSSRPKFPASACTKLFRREFLLNSQLKFQNDRKTNEDLSFIIDCIIKADSFDALDFPYYEYRQGREGSLTNSNTPRGFWDHSKFIIENKDKIDRISKKEGSYYIDLMSFLAYEYSIMICMYSRLKMEDKPLALEFLKKNSSILNYAKSTRVRLVKSLIQIIGIDKTSKLLDIYKRIR